MQLITRKGQAKITAARWKTSYLKNGEWRYGPDKERVYDELLALGNNPIPEDVNRVIGNNSWTNVKCDECDKYVEEVVQLGEELDYESCTANICKSCLILAMEEFVK